MLLTGELISGAEAEAWGLATRAFAPEEFERGVDAVVDRLAGRSRDALRTVKRMLAQTSDLGLDEAIRVDASRSASMSSLPRTAPPGSLSCVAWSHAASPA